MAAPDQIQGTLKNGEIEKPAKPTGQKILKTLLEWKAPSRLFKKRDREYFTTIGSIVFLLVVILLLLKEWLLIMAIVALTFVVYVMSTVPPEEIEHKITNQGVTTGGKTYIWEELTRFWLTEKWGQKMLHLQTIQRFPRILFLILGKDNEEKVKNILSQYLPYDEPKKNWMDEASEWLSARIPLEKTS